MGGLMGAMTAFMLLNGNPKAISGIVFLISAIIIIGLNYMIYKETREMEIKNKEGTLFVIILSFILTIITIWIMVFGPRSVLFQ